MMDFETWNRETLINEVKTAITQESNRLACKSQGITVKPTFYYSDQALQQKTNYELRILYVQFKKHDDAFCQEYEENEEKKRFFNQPVCNANFCYWSKQAYWTIDEAIALILGKDPRKVTWENVKPYLPTSPFAKKFHELQELAKRYVKWNQLFDPVLPGIFLAWAKRMDIDIPLDLQKAISSMGIQIADWKGNYEKTVEQYNQLNKFYDEALGLIQAKEQIIEALSLRIANAEEDQKQSKADGLKETERQSLYKLIAAMAYDGYGHNPLDKKSPLPKEISDAVTSYLSENIDPDTARKWLKKATNAYPNQTLTKTE